MEGRTTFKNFLASFTIHNTNKLKKLNGLKLFDEFVPTLQKYLAEHNGIKFYFNARFEMHRKLLDEVIEKDTEWWRTSNIHSVNDLTNSSDAIKTNKNNLIQSIPEMKKKGSG